MDFGEKMIKRKHHKNRKLFVLGLDGATWDILLPLIRRGLMPTLESIIEKGAWGDLESTFPPVTGPSWASFATGKNPCKTGVFDYFGRETNEYRLEPTSSLQLKNNTFWDFLSNIRYRVGIVAFPTLYPPYAINGFMVSGALAPTSSSICFPPELALKLRKLGQLRTAVNYHSRKYDDEELFLDDLNEFVHSQKEMVKQLLKEEWDLFVYVFSATDWIQHLMWKHIDETHPLHDSVKSPRLAQRFNEFYQQVDSFIREVLDLLESNTNLIILSDHGFGIQDQCFNLAKWLADKGYMTKTPLRRRTETKARKGMLQFLNSINKNLKVKRFFPKGITQRVSKSLEPSIADLVDFKRSKAYCLGHTIPFGAIYINLEGRDSEGIVDPKEYEALKREIISNLHELSNEVGDNLNVEVHDPKEIYNCPITNSAPDILFTINNWRCVILENDFNRPLFEEKSFSRRHTGSHRMNGIFLAYGPDIRRHTKLRDLKIVDIAPTILHIFDAPIPTDIDGRVLFEIFEPSNKNAIAKPEYTDANYYKRSMIERKDTTKAGEEPEQPFTPEEEEEIKDRLRRLGYL